MSGIFSKISLFFKKAAFVSKNQKSVYKVSKLSKEVVQEIEYSINKVKKIVECPYTLLELIEDINKKNIINNKKIEVEVVQKNIKQEKDNIDVQIVEYHDNDEIEIRQPELVREPLDQSFVFAKSDGIEFTGSYKGIEFTYNAYRGLESSAKGNSLYRSELRDKVEIVFLPNNKFIFVNKEEGEYRIVPNQSVDQRIQFFELIHKKHPVIGYKTKFLDEVLC